MSLNGTPIQRLVRLLFLVGVAVAAYFALCLFDHAARADTPTIDHIGETDPIASVKNITADALATPTVPKAHPQKIHRPNITEPKIRAPKIVQVVAGTAIGQLRNVGRAAVTQTHTAIVQHTSVPRRPDLPQTRNLPQPGTPELAQPGTPELAQLSTPARSDANLPLRALGPRDAAGPPSAEPNRADRADPAPPGRMPGPIPPRQPVDHSTSTGQARDSGGGSSPAKGTVSPSWRPEMTVADHRVATDLIARGRTVQYAGPPS